MAKKAKPEVETPPAEITEEQITKKVADSIGQMTRDQAKLVLEVQRDHDAALGITREEPATE